MNVENIVKLVNEEKFMEFRNEFLKYSKIRGQKKKEHPIYKAIEKLYEQWRRNTIPKFYDPAEADNRLKLALVVAAKTLTYDKPLATSQVRKFLMLVGNVYRNLKTIKGEEEKSKLLLESLPKIRYIMAYTASRHQSAMPIAEVVDAIVSDAKDEKRFETFYEFLQAVVAYHKFLGGGE
jgi:CRISPR-associated protein Csm2